MDAGSISSGFEILRKTYPHAGDFCAFTDVSNLPSIFAESANLSRNRVSSIGSLAVDCASPEVLANTPDWVHDHARLYFAPLTPMLYQVEGIKRTADQHPECPMPVYLVFELQVLALEGAKISDGNMGSRQSHHYDVTETSLRTLPYPDIYRRGADPRNQTAVDAIGFDPDQADRMRRRQAEVLVPEQIPSELIQSLVFRSEAERDLASVLCGELPRGLRVSIDPRWFFADQRQRVYLDKYTKTEPDLMTFNHSRTGDTVLKVTHAPSGVFRAWSIAREASAWGSWEVISLDDHSVVLPEPGQTNFYLYGHRIATRPVQ